jgi:hypothetical protein
LAGKTLGALRGVWPLILGTGSGIFGLVGTAFLPFPCAVRRRFCLLLPQRNDGISMIVDLVAGLLVVAVEGGDGLYPLGK